MSIAHLRPRTAGEILDGAFVLYRTHFAVLVGATLLPHLPLLAYRALGPLAGLTDASGWEAVAVVYDRLATLLFWGALAHLCAAAVQGGDLSVGAAYRRARGLFWLLLGQSILAGLLTGLALIALIVPGIAVYVLYFLAPHVMVVEGKGVSDSLDRSWNLVRAEWRRVAGVLAVTAVIFLLPFLLVGAVEGMAGAGSAWVASASGVLQVLLYVLAYPFAAASATLLYFDCRVRSEALDLVAAAEALPAHA
ncbi:MAG: hypothetical protein AB1941_22865 [Gemmatimonadota bacterium]